MDNQHLQKSPEVALPEAAGLHVIAEFSGCNFQVLSDSQAIRQALIVAAEKAGAQVLEVLLHQFTPQGVSGVAVIAESHISIHTWPELAYAAIDIYTCGAKTDPQAACAYLGQFFQASRQKVTSIKRGFIEDGRYSHQLCDSDEG